MAGRMPPEVRATVAREVLDRAVDIHWEELSFRARSAAYSEWVEDPSIGGIIGQYLAPDRIRLWIKDGPIKEYQRARRGHGPYAKLIAGAEGLEKDIALAVCGPGWSVKEGSIEIKPPHFTATNSNDDEVDVIWGSFVELKHVVWHWLTGPLGGDCILVVVGFPQHPITDEVLSTVSRLEKRLKVSFKVVSV